MGIFGKRRVDAPPSWWPHSKADWREFIGYVRAEMQSRNIPIKEEFEEGHIVFDDQKHLGLFNVSACWPQVPRGERRVHVADFIGTVLEAAVDEAKVTPELLRATIHPVDMPLDAAYFVRKRLCDSFCVQVMLDRSNSARAVCQSDIEDIGLPFETAIDIAVDNVWKNEPHNVDRSEIKDIGQLTMVYGDSMYTAANVLHIERFINPACARGVVVAVPNRHMFCFVRSDEPSFRELLNPLAHLAMQEARGEYAVTADLVWWRDGAFTRIGWPGQNRYEIGLPPELTPE